MLAGGCYSPIQLRKRRLGQGTEGGRWAVAEQEPELQPHLIFHFFTMDCWEKWGECKSRFCKLILFKMPWGACHSGNPRLNSFINWFSKYLSRAYFSHRTVNPLQPKMFFHQVTNCSLKLLAAQVYIFRCWYFLTFFPHSKSSACSKK